MHHHFKLGAEAFVALCTIFGFARVCHDGTLVTLHFRSDISASVRVQLSCVNGTDGVFLAGRVDRGGCGAWGAEGIFLWLFKDNVQITGDLSKCCIFSVYY